MNIHINTGYTRRLLTKPLPHTFITTPIITRSREREKIDNSLVLRATEKRIYVRTWLSASVYKIYKLSALRVNKSLPVSVKAEAKQTERCILAERETGSFVSLQSSRISQQFTSALLHTTLLLVFNISCVVLKILRSTSTTVSFLKVFL